MKRDVFKKVISLGLTLSLALPMATAFAQNSETEEAAVLTATDTGDKEYWEKLTPRSAHTPDPDKTQKVSYNYSYDKTAGYSNADAHERVMEKLDRGLVAIKTDDGAYLSWRLFDSEDARYGSADANVAFNIYRNNQKIATVNNSTNYIDRSANLSNNISYSVAPVIDGSEGEKCEGVGVLENSYYDIKLDKPADAVLPAGKTTSDGKTTIEYEAHEASCGDLDGDGQYELVIKWTAGISSSGMSTVGFTGPILLDAYELDGTKLWEQPINLGANIYSDEHNMQFLVYDFDGDGKAEITCQTSAGSKDAKGNYVSAVSADSRVTALDNSRDYRDANGRTLTAPELFTVFSGKTGGAIDTIYYPIALGNSITFGDSRGNRSTRFLADVSYLDGETPYAVYWRGYYTANGDASVGRTGVFGARFDGERLDVKYVFDTYDIENSRYASGYTGIPAYTAGNEKYIGQGNHNITTADVDGDGKDEVISGALCFEVNGNDKLMPKWCSFRGHGDYLHIGDYDPTNKGLEYFSVHEGGFYIDETTGERVDIVVTMPDGTEKSLDYGMTVYDAATGNELIHIPNGADTKNGIMANTGQGDGYYIISASTGVGTYSCGGGTQYKKISDATTYLTRIFWDGDLLDELGNINIIDWDGNAYTDILSGVSMGTRERFCLIQADLFGDWREELIIPTKDSTKLKVFMTPYATNYKIKTLMHDPIYRSGVAAEQTATHVPPHVGFYMGKELFEEETPKLSIVSPPVKTTYAKGAELDTTGLKVEAVYENNNAAEIKDYTLSGYDPNTPGEQTVTVTYLNQTATFKVNVKELSSIAVSRMPYSTVNYQGAPLLTDGLEVSAQYSDGSEEALLKNEYSLSYSFDSTGEKTVTVTYNGKSTTFNVTVKPAEISALNRTYYTNSTESVQNTIPIGNHTGDFVVEYTMKINSMPANCGDGKNANDGFFAQFANKSASKIGGGWYLKSYGDNATIAWKGSGKDEHTDIGTLEIGETYKLKFEFTGIGGGSATAAFTVTDMDGKVVGTAAGLPMRQFSDGQTAPVSTVYVLNRANTNSEASVSISNAITYSSGSAPTEYPVTFVNYDGSMLQQSIVAVGATPQYTGAEPTKPGDSSYLYTFAGWSPEITAVTGIAIYTAQFKSVPKEYNVKYQPDGSAVATAPEAGTHCLIFAAYKDGVLTSVKTADAVFTKAEEITVPKPDGFVTDGADTVKVMMWNSLKEMKPMAYAAEKAVTQ